jgi:CMP-N,N'-diacetyllegionaminic acid synthase
MKEKAVCLIPARGGSKRIPGKNIRILAGQPLIKYTIDAALNSQCFSNVIVSSDDDSILEIAEQCGAGIDRRPADLSGDHIKAVEVIDEFLKRPAHINVWENIAMCMPTCPFRESDDIVQAMNLFLREAAKCPRLIGVTKCDFPPQLALTSKGVGTLVDMREPDAYQFSTRSQDCEQLFFPNGSIYVSKVSSFLSSGTFFGKPMLAYVMPAERSFDIDYPYQFDIAQCLMEMRIRERK